MSPTDSASIVLNTAPLGGDLRASIAAQGFELLDVPLETPLQGLDAQTRGRVVGWLCTAKTAVSDQALGQLPGLRVISTFAVGVDNIAVAAALARGIPIGHTPGVLDRAVADMAFGLVLCLARNLLQNDRFVRGGGWQFGAPPLATDPRGKLLGLVGMGRIGTMLARLAQGYGMRVAYFQRHRDTALEAQGLAHFRDRQNLFETADFVSVHLPLTEATRQSIGATEFGWMKPGAYFINTGRGQVVDEEALIDALRSRRIAGAGLDVMATEPLPPSSVLCDLPNVILQPHAGSATVETRRAMMELAVANLLAGLAGHPLPAALPAR